MDTNSFNFLILAVIGIIAGAASDSICPYYSPPAEPCESEPGQCSQNSDCRIHHQCCQHPCFGGSCLVEPVVLGCPRIPFLGLLCLQFIIDECKSDDDCKGKARCCPWRCSQLRCIEPESKPGLCPNEVNTKRRRRCHARLECGADSDCDGEQKCCETNCGGSQCQDPIPEPPKVCFRNKETGRDCVCVKKRECMYSRSVTICKKRNRKCKQKGYVCCCGQFDWSQKKCEKKKRRD